MKHKNIAVIGATGLVGETIVHLLHERGFPIAELTLWASTRSAGHIITHDSQHYTVKSIEQCDFNGIDIAFFCAGSDVSAHYIPLATAAGCVVIDKSSYFRYDLAVPLVIADVNPEKIADYKNKLIIANPNCSTIQMLVALKPIYDAVGITRINVCTYQSVSGTGKLAMNELAEQSSAVENNQPVVNKVYAKPIVNNVIPAIDSFQANGYTKEEMKLVWETQKIFDDVNILVNATAVRVPVFIGHAEAVHIETREKITVKAVNELLRQTPGIILFEGEDYPTPREIAGTDEVYVGRVREDISHPRGINLWVVADNIRKGAALNGVQIAEKLLPYLA